MLPIIGITCGLKISNVISNRIYRENSVGFDYVRAIEHAGGVPVVLPIIENQDCISGFIDMIDGLLLSGGGDIEPSLFDEEPNPSLGSIDPLRDWVEMELTAAALQQNLPILAICRGIQVLNVAAGGTLYQDISQHAKTLVKHRQSAPGWHASHTINIEPETILFKIFGSQTGRVNSYHHQAVREPAEGFIVSARSTDMIIEAIESQKRKFVLGVQFHPEMMWERHQEAASIFSTFVKWCM